MTPNEKALKVLDLLLAKFNLTKETCPLGTFIEYYTTLHQAKFCRPRGTLVEDYGMLAFIRYNGLIVARYDESTEMSDEIAKTEVSRIVEQFGPPQPDFSANYIDDPIPSCFQGADK